MKKEIVQYATGKFKHFDGTEREFTVCMASISPIGDWIETDIGEDEPVLLPANITSIVTEKDDVDTAWERYLCFGVSVRNPKDTYNESLAKKISYGKAHSSKGYTVAFDNLALMSSSVAKAMLDNFVERVTNDPSLAIENYNMQKMMYEKKCKKQA